MKTKNYLMLAMVAMLTAGCSTQGAGGPLDDSAVLTLLIAPLSEEAVGESVAPNATYGSCRIGGRDDLPGVNACLSGDTAGVFSDCNVDGMLGGKVNDRISASYDPMGECRENSLEGDVRPRTVGQCRFAGDDGGTRQLLYETVSLDGRPGSVVDIPGSVAQARRHAKAHCEQVDGLFSREYVPAYSGSVYASASAREATPLPGAIRMEPMTMCFGSRLGFITSNKLYPANELVHLYFFNYEDENSPYIREVCSRLNGFGIARDGEILGPALRPGNAVWDIEDGAYHCWVAERETKKVRHYKLPNATRADDALGICSDLGGVLLKDRRITRMEWLQRLRGPER